jgi:hypothetical protein
VDDIASQRVEHAKRRFDESWLNRRLDRQAVEQDLDELEVAVALWLDAQQDGDEARAASSEK